MITVNILLIYFVKYTEFDLKIESLKSGLLNSLILYNFVGNIQKIDHVEGY